MRLTAAASVDVALDHARTLSGVTDCIVFATHDSLAALRWANNTVTTNATTWDTSMSVVAFFATAHGVAQAALHETFPVFDAASVRSLVERAVAVARASEPVHDAPSLVSGLELGDWAAPARTTDATVFATIAPALGREFTRAGSCDRSHAGYAEHVRSSTWVGSLGGLRLRLDGVDGRVEMTARSLDGRRSAWEGVNSRDFTRVDIDVLTGRLERQLGWQRTTRALAPGKYTTILPPGAVGDLLATFDANLCGRDAVEGSGPFSRPGGRTRIGERLFDAKLQLFSDPAHPGLEVDGVVVDLHNSSTSSVFDIGLLLGRTDWVRNGTLQALANSRLVAAETGLPHTPDVGNLILEVDGGHGSLDDVVARTPSGLLVTSLWYIRDLDEATMTVTGMTRDGVYEVRDGEIVGAVNNFRFNESPLAVLRRIRDSGRTEVCQPRENAETFSTASMPTLVVDDFTMSSISDAQ